MEFGDCIKSNAIGIKIKVMKRFIERSQDYLYFALSAFAFLLAIILPLKFFIN